jgi:hypothetical protein
VPDDEAQIETETEAEVDGGAVERGTEHLQSAAREMLSAARAFLDAVEDLVEDPDRIKELSHVVGTVAQQAARVGRSAFAAGSDPAWFDRDDDVDDLDSETDDGEPLF